MVRKEISVCSHRFPYLAGSASDHVVSGLLVRLMAPVYSQPQGPGLFMPPRLGRATMAHTPTISSVASSDISFDDLPAAGSDADSQLLPEYESELVRYDDPALFIQDMVNIEVYDWSHNLGGVLIGAPGQEHALPVPCDLPHGGFSVLRQAPRNTSQESNVAYPGRRRFSLGVRESTSSSPHPVRPPSRFCSASALTRHRLGVTPLSTLAEWTNVLHLSSKWSFAHLRTAAQQALLPLMSPVDKLVLARTYGFTEWISDAYVGLLGREDDLDEDDVIRMSPKDIVAVAKGRRQAGKANVRSRAEILRVVQSVLSPADAPVASVSPAVQEPLGVQKAKANVSTATSLPGDAHTLVSRWLDQVTVIPTAAGACLIKYMEEDHSRISLVLDLALQRAWQEFQRCCQEYGANEYSPSYFDDYLGQWDAHLKSLHNKRSKLGLYHSHRTMSACLRFVDEWRGFCRLDLCQGTNLLFASGEWQTLIRQTMFLGRCTTPNHGQPPPTTLVDGSVHSALWRAMSEFFTATDPQCRIVVAQLLRGFLRTTKYFVSRVEASWEEDTFYRDIEGALQETQDTRLRSLLQARTVQVTPHHVPSSHSGLGNYQQSSGSLVTDGDRAR
jgi:hypothetical protein